MAEKLYFLVNGASAPACVEILPSMTQDDLRSALYALADIPDTEKEVLVKITKDDGTVVPMSVHIIPNSAATPYILTVKSNKTQSLTVKQSLIDSKLSEIATALQSLKEFAGLKEQMQSLQLKIEEAAKNVSTGNSIVRPLHTPVANVKKLSKIDPRFQSQPKYIFTPETTAYLKLPSFNNWQWEENEMSALLEHMFFELGLVDHYKIELPALKRFLSTVKDNYNLNPFHNYRHCFCVTQMMYGLLHVTNLVNKLDMTDKLILLVSAICHDLDHPGFNNAYQVNAKTELAIIYNDQSPLENHHCAVAFTILKDPDTNILKNVPEKEWWEVRKGIIRCILATDMAKHAEYMAKTKAMAETFNVNDTEHRQLLQVMLMKCSDISNEARPADVAEPWVDCLLEEFFAQSDLEKVQGLPVAPFMDREKVTKTGAQIGFIGFVMIPLFEMMARILPEIETHILPQIRSAHNYYKDLAAKQQAEAQAKKAAESK